MALYSPSWPQSGSGAGHTGKPGFIGLTCVYDPPVLAGGLDTGGGGVVRLIRAIKWGPIAPAVTMKRPAGRS